MVPFFSFFFFLRNISLAYVMSWWCDRNGEIEASATDGIPLLCLPIL